MVDHSIASVPIVTAVILSTKTTRTMTTTRSCVISILWLLFSAYISPLDAISDNVFNDDGSFGPILEQQQTGNEQQQEKQQQQQQQQQRRRRPQNASSLVSTRQTQEQPQQQATTGNCVAGGSGYGLYFDYTRSDVVSLRWTNIPKEAITVEFWYLNTDPFLPVVAAFAYSAFNMNGYQDGGGEVYEAANELVFLISPHRMTLWREVSNVELLNEVNPKVGESFSDGKWHHYAFTIDSHDGGAAALYLDGKQLDFGTTIVDGVDSYQKATFSNDWDVAESPDAIEYYGEYESPLFYIENPCSEDSYTVRQFATSSS